MEKYFEDAFTQFVMEWTTKYKPMRHDPSPEAYNRRFFLCDGFAGMADLCRTLEPDLSPCVQMESAEEGEQTADINNREYVIYFCARADDPSDGASARACKTECGNHKTQFLQYVRSKMRDLINLGVKPAIERVGYRTIGPLFDGWNAVQITLNVQQAYFPCLDTSLLLD